MGSGPLGLAANPAAVDVAGPGVPEAKGSGPKAPETSLPTPGWHQEGGRLPFLVTLVWLPNLLLSSFLLGQLASTPQCWAHNKEVLNCY